MPQVPPPQGTPPNPPQPAERSAPTCASPHAPEILRIEHLSFAHPGDPALFSDFSATLCAGVTLLSGDTGCGKTTLLRLLAGELKRDRGALRWVGATVGDTQSLCWFDPRDADFDSLGCAQLMARLQTRHPALDVAAWDAHISAFGLTPHRDKPLYMLSTGSRRKAGLAVALSARSRLTLLDEPTAGLDLPSREHLQRSLSAAARDPDRAVLLACNECLADIPGAHSWVLGGPARG